MSSGIVTRYCNSLEKDTLASLMGFSIRFVFITWDFMCTKNDSIVAQLRM